MGRDIVALDDLTVNNLGVFKKINQVCLPTKYPDSWYQDSLNSDQIVKLAFYSELPVGAIKAKTYNKLHKINNFENLLSANLPSKVIPNAVYLESFAVLEAYRGLGVGQKLMDFLIEETKKKFIHEIIIHVHVDNEVGLNWYLKRGFVKNEEVVKDYYKDQGLQNPDAYVLTLTV